MDCAARNKTIMEAKTFGDVEKVLQEAKVSRSALELARTAYQIREAQPNVARQFLTTVIKEMEEKDAEKKEKETEGGLPGSGEVGGTSRTLVSDELKHTDAGQVPDTGFPGAQDQMKEGLFDGLHPDIAAGMQPQMQNMPPLSLPNQIKQMQYTVRKMVAPLVKEIADLKAENQRIKEAYTALDTKIKETISKGSVKLEMPAPSTGITMKSTRETVLENQQPTADIFAVKESLEDKRARILSQDLALSGQRTYN